MTLVATQVKRRRGTTAENDAFTGAEGEITVDTTTHELRVHDGSTVGGHTIPTKTKIDDLLSNKANVALDNITNAGKEVCANMSMPSNRRVNLTLGASGTEYTSPADGWYSIAKTSTATGQRIQMFCDITGLNTSATSAASGNNVRCFLPVKKNDIIRIIYDVPGSLIFFYFIYAQGAR